MLVFVVAGGARHSDHLPAAVLSRSRAGGQQRERGGSEHPGQ